MKNKKLIAISGKIGNGKDTISKMLQILLEYPEFTNSQVISQLDKFDIFTLEERKFGRKLKMMLSILLNCNIEDLEDREFKESVLPKHWWYYKSESPSRNINKSEYEGLSENRKTYFKLYKPTVREFLQKLGSECGREILHPSLWAIALFNEYTEKSNWVINDLRFKDELHEVNSRNGITIRVNRKIKKTSEQWYKENPSIVIMDPDGWDRGDGYEYEWFEELITFQQFNIRRSMSTCIFNKDEYKNVTPKEHYSETDLDKYKDWDYVINNNKDLDYLVNEVRTIIKRFDLK